VLAGSLPPRPVGAGIDVLPFGEAEREHVFRTTAQFARQYKIATILGTEQPSPAGRLNVAVVFDARGELLGCQTKNQVAPSEDPFYVPGRTRQVFEVNGVKFGVAICHEGWRYPETVRWAATRRSSSTRTRPAATRRAPC
jgi:predicted amidohydrolase